VWDYDVAVIVLSEQIKKRKGKLVKGGLNLGLRHPNPRPSSFSLYSRQSPSLAGNHRPPSTTHHRREKETPGPLPTRHRPSTTTTLHPPLLTAEPTQKNHALPAQFHHPRAGIRPPTPPSTSSINVGPNSAPNQPQTPSS